MECFKTKNGTSQELNMTEKFGTQTACLHLQG